MESRHPSFTLQTLSSMPSFLLNLALPDRSRCKLDTRASCQLAPHSPWQLRYPESLLSAEVVPDRLSPLIRTARSAMRRIRQCPAPTSPSTLPAEALQIRLARLVRWLVWF